MRATSVFTRTIAVTTGTAYLPRPGSGAEFRERVHAGRGQPGEQALEHVGGGLGVGQGAVAGPGPGAEEPGERRQLAVGGLGLPGDRTGLPRGGENGHWRPRNGAVVP